MPVTRVNEIEHFRYAARLDDVLANVDWFARAAYFVFDAADDAEAMRAAADAMKSGWAARFCAFVWHACPEILWSDGVARLVRVSAISDERLNAIAKALPSQQEAQA